MKQTIANILTAAGAFALSSMAGSGAVFCYIVITQGPRLNETAGNIAAGLIAIVAISGLALAGVYSAIVKIKGGYYE
tara:strand:+ start:420 stop:650 length:231 start_codon:yes stop_codon:yes gene_type:complete